MQLTFLGTRGEIEQRTRRHRMHTSLMVLYRGADVMIDCGLDWLGKFERLHPSAIVLPHAHPDHAWGLKRGFIHDRQDVLKGVQVYIGDGATVTTSFIRRRGKRLIGHSLVRTKLTWCEKEGVPQAIITHRGSEIVTGGEHKLSAKLRAMATERGIKVRIAYDGMKLEL